MRSIFLGSAALVAAGSVAGRALPPLPLVPGAQAAVSVGTTTTQGEVLEAGAAGLRLRDSAGAESLIAWGEMRTLKPLSPIAVTLVLADGSPLPAGTRLSGNLRLCSAKAISVVTSAGEIYSVLWEHVRDVASGVEAATTGTAPAATSTAAAPAAEVPLNPDRWTTLELDQSAANSLKNTNILYPPGQPDTEYLRRTLDVATSVSALFPLADALSVTLGLGGEWAETDTNTAGVGGGGFTDSDLVTYRAAARWYFEAADSPRRAEWLNPDRWASLALGASGAATTNYYAGNANGNTPQESSTSSQNVTLDARVPLADAWTVTASVTGNRTSQETGTANAPGTSTGTVSTNVSASAGLRWYLLRRNLIVDDAHVNPDMWTMLWLTASTGQSLSVRRTLPSGLVRDKDTSSRTLGLQAGTRLPISGHLSLNFSAELDYARSAEPQTPASGGFLTRSTSLTFATAARYFLF